MRKTLCAALALCVIACGKSEETRAPEQPAPQVSVTREPEFNFNADQFAHAFNAASKTFGQSYRIHKVEIKHGAVHDYFEHKFTHDVSLTVGVSKETGHILNITALVAGNGDATDNRHALMAISEVVTAASDPNMPKEKASKLVSDMLKEAGQPHESGQFPQRFINHVRYVLRSGSSIGSWWIASPA